MATVAILFATALSLSRTVLGTHVPPGWTPVGCFSDSISDRALASFSTTSNSNTPNACIATCQGMGYSYAGVEFGKECFCANQIITSTSPSSGQQVTTGDCSMACSGDSSRSCGAGNRIFIYSYTQRLPSGWGVKGCYTDSTSNRVLEGFSTTTSRNTPASCAANCASRGFSFAGVEFGKECYCSNDIKKTSSTGQLVALAECAMPCPGNAALICGGSGRTIILSPIATSWTRLGCFSDGTTRALQGSSVTSSSNSPTSCTAKCALDGFTYAGVENETECYCSNKITVIGNIGTIQPDSDCSMACAGDPTKKCGGGFRLDVYFSVDGTTPPGWRRLGCFTDSSSARALQNGFHSSTPTNSRAYCLSTCMSHGYKLAGLENGVELFLGTFLAMLTFCNIKVECFCSNAITTDTTGQLTADTECSMPCAGDPTFTCGNGNRIEIFGNAAWDASAVSP